MPRAGVAEARAGAHSTAPTTATAAALLRKNTLPPPSSVVPARVRVQRHRQKVETPQRPEQFAPEFLELVPAFPGPLTNGWHGEDLYAEICAKDGAEAVTLHPDRTLFLSWPPYAQDVGARILMAYKGVRVI
jgi:hypothetical protein